VTGSAAEPGSAPALIDSAIAEGRIPGAVLAAGVRTEQPMLLYVAGDAQRDSQARRPMTADTIFDLASLTKVTATLPCILRLTADSDISLDDPVRRFLPAFAGTGKDQVTVRQLLTHTSGLPDHRKYYEYLPDAPAVRAAVLAEPLEAAPGSVFRYSDLGFILLGEIAQTVSGTTLSDLARLLVFGPLGMPDTMYLPPAGLTGRIAATEPVAGIAKVGPAKVGTVHDENAEALGGVAGHAGLFGTVHDLARYAAAWVAQDTSDDPASPWLPSSLRAQALHCQTEGLDGRRGLGWGLRHDRWDNMGDGWPEAGAGHTGFTGTSLSVDPQSGLWAVLLTNAVHFGRGPEHSAVGLRKQVHAAVAATLLPATVL
jgi:CubicO group peptidase (beta-lactamase class C family)